MIPVREAIILAGGFGTRLAHVVPDVCKPMAPVADRPFLRFLLDQLSSARFSRVVIADGYRREQIENFFGSSYRGVEIVYSAEDLPLLTGGAVKQALEKCSSYWVYVLNGDTWLDIDFDAMESTAFASRPEVESIIAVKNMTNADRYGTVGLDEEGTLTAFYEKQPRLEGFINAGVYLLRRDCLDGMPVKFSLESDYFESVVSEGALRSVVCEGDFIDIGVPDDYCRAQSMLAPLARNWKLAMFDRDGTINVDTGHLHEFEKLELVSSTIEIMRHYSEDPDYKIVVVTNQAGIAKGLYDVEDMTSLHRAMTEKLFSLGVCVDAWYYCPHHPDYTGRCSCRKPEPGLLLDAMKDFDAIPENCIMYGDSASDELAAINAGVRFVRVNGAYRKN